MFLEKISEEAVIEQLRTVIDPELGVDIVSLGLIYEVVVRQVQVAEGKIPHIHILMTLTTPGCPLIGVIDRMIRDAVLAIPGTSGDQLTVELTFDPPWIADMMDDAARAELGL